MCPLISVFVCTGKIRKVSSDCWEGKMGAAIEVFEKVKIVPQISIALSVI